MINNFKFKIISEEIKSKYDLILMKEIKINYKTIELEFTYNGQIYTCVLNTENRKLVKIDLELLDISIWLNLIAEVLNYIINSNKFNTKFMNVTISYNEKVLKELIYSEYLREVLIISWDSAGSKINMPIFRFFSVYLAK